jgi:hypothetical protein
MLVLPPGGGSPEISLPVPQGRFWGSLQFFYRIIYERYEFIVYFDLIQDLLA